MNHFLFFVFFLLVSTLSFSQDRKARIDSLYSLYRNTENTGNQVQTTIELSRNYRLLNIDSSIKYADEAVAIAKGLNDERLLLDSKWAQARAMAERDIPASMKIYYEILEIARKLNDKPSIATCYYDIGLLYLYAGSGEKYVDNLRKAKTIYKELGDADRLKNCNAEIGGIYSTQNSDSARHYLNLADNDTSQWVSHYRQYYWGNTEADDNPEKARRHYLKSLELSLERNDLRCYALASRWYSIFLKDQLQIDSAIVVAKSGLAAADKLGFLRGTVNNSEQLHHIYDQLDETDSAYKYLSINIKARDALLSQDKINQIQQATIAEQQRAQKLQMEKEKIQSQIRLFGAGGLAVVFILFAAFFYRNQLKTKKSNHILRKQTEEINKKNNELQSSYENLKSAQAQLIQSEKMASLGELTAGIAHEIQNPLNFVNNFSELSNELIDEMTDEFKKGDPEEGFAIADDIKQNLKKITHHGKRADAIVKGMLAHSRAGKGEKELTDINALSEEYLKLSYHGLRAKDKSFNVDFKTDFDPNLPKVNVVPQDIGRVLLNLINNAFQAVNERSKKGEPGYKPEVFVETQLKTNNQILITIRDNGPGIPDSIKDKIFQPFFTTKPTGQGTGLGLSLSYDIVKAHGGELKIESTTTEGSVFTIVLPTKAKL